MTVGQFIKRYREAKQISGKQMAIRLGVSPYRLQKWENNDYHPKFEDSEKIKDYFTLDSLYDISEEVLKARIATLNIDKEESVEKLLRQKDRQLEEKEKQIRELSKMVNTLEEAIAQYKTKEKVSVNKIVNRDNKNSKKQVF